MAASAASELAVATNCSSWPRSHARDQVLVWEALALKFSLR
jgi:hypothetical protein